MHPRCQQEPELTYSHESNENQAKEPFSLSGRSRVDQHKTSSQKIRTDLENIRVGQMFAKNNTLMG